VIIKGDRLEIKKEIWERLWKSNYDWEIEPDLHVFDPKTYEKWLSGGDPFLEEIEKGKIVGGFAHHQVIALADKVVEAVKNGAIKRFFVMAGCDGRMKSRDYYTEFAQKIT